MDRTLSRDVWMTTGLSGGEPVHCLMGFGEMIGQLWGTDVAVMEY
jgi:hypothetical protein